MRKPKNFSKHDMVKLSPKTATQKEVWDEFYRRSLITLTGAAGSGKTMCAIYLAFKEVFNDWYKKVVIVRSAVPTRDIGFLPGDQSEKMEVYERPYMDICDFIFNYQSNNYRNLKEAGYLDFMPTSFLRGLTIDDAVIVVDEFSNMTFHELDSILTRVGEDSKIVFCGDIDQTDLFRSKSDKPGFHEFMNVLDNMPSHWNAHFTADDILRSGIVKEYLQTKARVK